MLDKKPDLQIRPALSVSLTKIGMLLTLVTEIGQFPTGKNTMAWSPSAATLFPMTSDFQLKNDGATFATIDLAIEPWRIQLD